MKSRFSDRQALHAISALRVTPVAISDPPLLNSTGVHEPFALRSVLELETGGGLVGLGESYGDDHTLNDLERAAEALEGLDPFDLNGLANRLCEVMGVQARDVTTALATSRTYAHIYGAIEVAMLDLQGKILERPVSDLLGGAVRDEVPFSAYLFFKFGRHCDQPADYPVDPWGEVLGPEELVEEARELVDRHGFPSLKLKGGVLEPEREVETIRMLRSAFPDHPLRLDPNACWSVDTSLRVARQLEGVLEYLEDPTPGLEGMAQVRRQGRVPLATNMVVTSFAHLEKAVELGSVDIVLADHHYWGGLKAVQRLEAICSSWGLGLSMHSNSHLGISLAAMAHVAAATPGLSYDCDTHYPWQPDDVITGGALQLEAGRLRVPPGPGLGVELDRDALERLNARYLGCGIRKRDDVTQMKKYYPDWTGRLPRY